MFADARAYERFMGRWSSLVASKLVDFAHTPARGRLLDVGSGTGALAFAVASKHPAAQLVGIDPSKEYVAYAQSQNRFGNRVSFEVGDAQKLRFADASFDACLSLLVFNFIPDPSKALSELRRVTKPSGSITAAVWDYGDGMKMLRMFWDAVVSVDPTAEKADEKNMPLCRSGELARLWRQSGLENVDEQAIEIKTRFDSFKDYWDAFLLGQGPAGAYVRKLAPEKVAALRADVKRRVSPASDRQSFTLPARVWAVRGSVRGPR